MHLFFHLAKSVPRLERFRSKPKAAGSAQQADIIAALKYVKYLCKFSFLFIQLRPGDKIRQSRVEAQFLISSPLSIGYYIELSIGSTTQLCFLALFSYFS